MGVRLPQTRLPEWVRKPIRWSEGLHGMKILLRGTKLHTVCEEARCPNMEECFTLGTATFMILGDVCTRRCGFCSVTTGKPPTVDPLEPRHVAEAVEKLRLKHVVLTSPARDDLPDEGAAGFEACVRALRNSVPTVTVEVLTPDFSGDEGKIARVARSGVHIYNHNIETVPRLQKRVRPAASYDRSLGVLTSAKKAEPKVVAKSGLMVGLGEREDEVIDVLKDLRGAGCEMVTIGQYLRPSADCLPVSEYVHPEVFARLRTKALELGFRQAASGPFVRSSYHAERARHEAGVTPPPETGHGVASCREPPTAAVSDGGVNERVQSEGVPR
ncbi:MAG: lipoyl synthase [Nitrospirae bacterium]|nr:lipoyl synthase [Nitrospirota bacterium]